MQVHSVRLQQLADSLVERAGLIGQRGKITEISLHQFGQANFSIEPGALAVKVESGMVAGASAETGQQGAQVILREPGSGAGSDRILPFAGADYFADLIVDFGVGLAKMLLWIRCMGGQGLLEAAEHLARSESEAFGGSNDLGGIIRGAYGGDQLLKIGRLAGEAIGRAGDAGFAPVAKSLVCQRQAFPDLIDEAPACMANIGKVIACADGEAQVAQVALHTLEHIERSLNHPRPGFGLLKVKDLLLEARKLRPLFV